MNPHTRHRIVTAVAAALPLFAAVLPASAQVRVNQSGRAHDANTRVGSDGSNDRNNGIDRRGQTVTGNQIVTGNVTGGRAFRGNLGYRDPLEFRGSISRPSDRFVRDSVGAPTRTQPSLGYQPLAFYGDDRATPPPLGFVRDGSTGGYRGIGQTTVATGVRNPAYQSTTQIFGAGSSLLRPSDVLFGGREPGGSQSILSASPLYGVRPIGEGPVLGVNDDPSRPSTIGTRDRFGMNRGQIDRMQQELNDAGGADDEANGADGAQDGAPTPGIINPEARPQRSIGGGLEDGGSGGANAGGRINADRLAGSVNTGQSLQRRVLVPPAQQSAQYRQLEQRLAQRQAAGTLTDEEANRQARLLARARDAAAGGAGAPAGEAAGNAPGADEPAPAAAPRRRGGAAVPPPDAPDGQPEPMPDDEPQPEADAPASAAPAPAAEADVEPQPAAPAGEAAPEPLRIKSLAEGVEAKGLRELLASAEELMKAGKFASAIEKYGAAQQVAPNNPLIVLGRAHAELGATYYGRAEQSLRQAIEADPALLMGQYDLEAFVGRDRLGFVVKDLKQISNTEAGAARPHLLLAYIAYSMPGNEAAAAQYLDAAAERSKGADPLIDLMRKNWNLPATPAPAETPDAEAPDAEEPEENK